MSALPYTLTVETAPLDEWNQDWCEGCGGHGTYRRIRETGPEGEITRFVAWLCTSCAADHTKIGHAYQMLSAERLANSERYASDEAWARSCA